MSIREQLVNVLLVGFASYFIPLYANNVVIAEQAGSMPVISTADSQQAVGISMEESAEADWAGGVSVLEAPGAEQASVLSANRFLNADEPIVVNIGVELSDEQIKLLPGHVFSNGSGLPSGSGSVEYGAELYSLHCARCHGSGGQGGKALELTGDRALLATDYPDRGIGVYWPYAPTLFEYIARSMPPEKPGMFSNDELYSLLAHLLYINGVVDESTVLDAKLLSDIKLPNKHGFDTIGN